jgi:hypothetical protein
MAMVNIMRLLATAVLLTILSGCVSASGQSPGALGPFCGKDAAPWLPGRYTMSGVPEVGSQLELKRDGSFAFMLAYGANDQFAQGCWTTTGRIVALFPAGRTRIGQHTPDTYGFEGIVLEIDGRDLVWSIPGSHYRGRYSK